MMPIFFPQSLIDEAHATHLAVDSLAKQNLGKRIDALEILIQATIHLWSGVAQSRQQFEDKVMALLDALNTQLAANSQILKNQSDMIAAKAAENVTLKQQVADLQTQLSAFQNDATAIQAAVDGLAADDATAQAVLNANATPPPG